MNRAAEDFADLKVQIQALGGQVRNHPTTQRAMANAQQLGQRVKDGAERLSELSSRYPQTTAACAAGLSACAARFAFEGTVPADLPEPIVNATTSTVSQSIEAYTPISLLSHAFRGVANLVR